MSEIPDVDIDVADHLPAMDLFAGRAVPASLMVDGTMLRHNSGIYLQKIPVNPLNRLAAFPYKIAEDLGYYKIDLLSNSVYQNVESMDELRQILATPIDWDWFKQPDFLATLFQLSGPVNRTMTVAQMVAQYEPRSIPDLACMLAVIRPAKKHLISEPWDVLREQIWLPEPAEKGKPFKKSHAIAYALVVGLDARIKARALEAAIQSASCEPDEDTSQPD